MPLRVSTLFEEANRNVTMTVYTERLPHGEEVQSVQREKRRIIGHHGLDNGAGFASAKDSRCFVQRL